MKNKPKISVHERDQIAIWLALKVPLREMARTLDRSVSSVSDEISRNSVDGIYSAHTAQVISDGRNHHSRQLNALKNSRIYSYVIKKLRAGWSPEEIAGRLKRAHKGKTIICHETIYRHIYSDEGRAKHLTEFLVRGHHKRRHWHGRSVYHKGIQNRVSIHDRPEEVDRNNTFGHWETDIVEGKGHSGGIQTMLERKTRYFQAKLIPKIDSEYGIKAQTELLTKYPRVATKTVTMDNGKENFNHMRLRHMRIDTYFCDPYCSWQKGSNENHNGILRRYIPKKTDFTTFTQTELNAILKEINDRPRKCLQYETSFEAFKRELKSISSSKGCSDRD